MILDTFRYMPDEEPRGGARVVRVPAGISDRDALFDVYARAFEFPAWFGRNWDAFEELLADLSWPDGGEVAIVHEDLPALEPDELRTYLRILSRRAVEDLMAGDGRESHWPSVFFPRSVCDRVREHIPSCRAPRYGE